MYVGRFVVVGPEVGAYRVSSRSFPNREAVARDGTVTVRPTADAEPTDNPYVEYNAVQVTDRGTVVGNGSHVDPIAEKLALGYPARDALAEPLGAMDFEKDDYDTPRIAGIVGVDPADPTTAAGGDGNGASGDADGADGGSGPGPGPGPGAAIGIVRRDALLVEAVDEPTLVATYEEDAPRPFALGADDAAGAARELYDHEFEHAVCAAGVRVADGGPAVGATGDATGDADVDVAVYNG